METDKEKKTPRTRTQTEKVQPVQPQRLLREVKERQRPPLRTLYNQRDNVAGPSHQGSRPLTVGRNVPRKQFSIRVDNLDGTDKSIIIISDDDEEHEDADRNGIIIISDDELEKSLCDQSEIENTDQSLGSRVLMYNVDVYIPKIFEHLLKRETIPSVVPFIPDRSRAGLINWFLKINKKGNPWVIQTACWYFDSIFAITDVPVGDLLLFAAACYWIASKIHSPQISAAKLVKYSDNAFTKEGLITAEKTVLSKLNYPLIPIIPQDFIGFLSLWCDPENHAEIQMAATFICLSAMTVNKMLCQEYPSVIAVASVRNALMLLDKLDLIQQFQRCSIVKAAMTKASKMSTLESIIMNRAVRIMSAPGFDYDVLYNRYNDPPMCIAARIAKAVNDQYLQHQYF